MLLLPPDGAYMGAKLYCFLYCVEDPNWSLLLIQLLLLLQTLLLLLLLLLILQKRTASTARTPRFGRGDSLPTIFSRIGDARLAVLSLLLLLSGDVDTNLGPSCYICGQTIHQSDTFLACHTPNYITQTHTRTSCIGVPRS